MDNPLSRTLQNVSPSTLRALALMTGGLVFAMLPCGVKPGKIPASLMLLTSTAMLTAAIAPLQRWEKEQEEDEKLKRAEEHILHARLTAQTLGAVEQAKQEFMPQTYSPQVLAAQVQAQMQQAIAPGLAVLPAGEASEVSKPVSGDTPLPLENLAKTTAHSKRSTVMIAPSGCGKTSFTRHYIHHTNDLYKGNVDLTVFDFKGDDEGFCGLEKSASDYYCFNGHEVVAAFYAQIEAIAGLLKINRQTVPTRWIADEFNNGLLDARTADNLAGRQSKKYYVLIPDLAYKLATQGRSKDILGLITSHSPQVDDIKLNTSILQSLWLIALGIPGNYAAIEQCLDGKVGIITDTSTRKRLNQQFEAVKHLPILKERVVALTNVPLEGDRDGTWRLVLLPNYSIDLGEIKRSPFNQSTTEILEEVITPDILQAVDSAVNELPVDYLKRMWQLEFEIKPKPMKAEETKPIDGEVTAFEKLPANVQRLIELVSNKKDAISWKQIRHFKGGGEKLSKAECLAIFKQSEALGWGVVAQDMTEPSWYLPPSQYLSGDENTEDTE